MSLLELTTPAGAPARFRITIGDGPALRIRVAEAEGPDREYRLADLAHTSFLDLYEALARDFRLNRPLARQAPPHDRPHYPLTPVLTEPISPQILYGYGDPCVVRVAADDYRLLVTSNDAPEAFPVLASPDLERWRLQGFVFPRGRTPAWALSGPDISDFWAPELHRVGASWWVLFCARGHDRKLAIGLARSDSPDGPFEADEAPLLTNGVIDPHVLIDTTASPWLVWKQDDNDVWPSMLNHLLHDHPRLVDAVFDTEVDRRTAALLLTLHPWICAQAPMQQFFALQPLIEAVAADLEAFALRLARLRLGSADRARLDLILTTLRTRVYAQRLSHDGRRLEGEATVILQNDLPWEGHLIEGVWITEAAGRYHLLYAANDFSTPLYGIGAAVAETPTGPYRKSGEAVLRSSEEWWGPGHPSVCAGPDGRRRMFLHAFPAGRVGYKAFRALMSVGIELGSGFALTEP